VASLRLRELTVWRGGTEVLRDLDLFVESGSSLAVLGQSGSGKSTLLRAIVGLDPPVSGTILRGNVDVTDVPVSERGIVMVAQQPALQPNLNLADNIERPLIWNKQDDPPSRRRRVTRELRRFGLAGSGAKKVNEAAAGEKHSAATARGTVRDPDVLLLDEPVTALDPSARRERVRQLRQQHLATSSTMVVATNDWAVAAGLADLVAVLDGGSIVQVDAPVELYDNPASIHVAELTGQWNLNRLAGTVRRNAGARTQVVTAAGPLETWRELPDRPMIVGIRPSDLTVITGDDIAPAQGGRTDLTGIVTTAGILGRASLVGVDADGLPLQALGPTPPPEIGSTIGMICRRAHLFTLDGEAIDHIEPDPG
jgi:ABC-type sugar transport system ATPase subunit